MGNDHGPMFPRHVAGYLKGVPDKVPLTESNERRYLALACPCGGDEFELLKSNLQTVVAICSRCNHLICVYDLAFYPAATKLKGDEQFQAMAAQLGMPSKVIVSYEYAPEEPDVEYNPDDITWIQIFIADRNGKVIEVFKDETA